MINNIGVKWQFIVIVLALVSSSFSLAADGNGKQTDPYKILGMSRSDSLESIKKEYKRLIQSMHPDKGGNDSDTAALTTAYAQIRKEFFTKGERPANVSSNEVNSSTKWESTEDTEAIQLEKQIQQNKYLLKAREYLQEMVGKNTILRPYQLKWLLPFDSEIRLANLATAVNIEGWEAIWKYGDLLAQFNTPELRKALIIGLKLKPFADFKYQRTYSSRGDPNERFQAEKNYLEMLLQFDTGLKQQALLLLIDREFEPSTLWALRLFNEEFLISELKAGLATHYKYHSHDGPLTNRLISEIFGKIGQELKAQIRVQVQQTYFSQRVELLAFGDYLKSPFARQLLNEVLREALRATMKDEYTNKIKIEKLKILITELDDSHDQCMKAFL